MNEESTASFATSVASRKSATEDLEADMDELAAIVHVGSSSSNRALSGTKQRVELEDRAKEPIEVQNLIKAAELAYTADVNARRANLISNTDTSSDDDDDAAAKENRKARVYECDASCAHDASGVCKAACAKWNRAWTPILKLIGDACNDHAAAFNALPATTSTVSSLTSIQARFVALVRDNAPLLALKPGALGRNAFVERAYKELCDEIGREFHQVRRTIRGQMCCVEKVACEANKLCQDVMATFTGDSSPWMTRDPVALGRHLSQCSPDAMAEHVKTLETTGAQLAIFEKAIFELTEGCAKIVERLRTQLSALENSRPKPAKKPAPGDWTRKAKPNKMIVQASFSECVYGRTNCSEDEFIGALRAFLDAEPNCGRIVYDGAVFFRDCYQNLAGYMKQHLKRTEQLQTTFNSLGDVLVQQRFIVHIGVALMRTMAKMPLHVNMETGKEETPMEVFHFLFGPTFRSTMPDADFYPIQLELSSKGAKLPNTLRTYLYNVHTARHMNAIQKAGSALFTAELDCLAEAVTQCAKPDFDTSDIVVASRDRARTGIAEMGRLCKAVLKYVDKKHPCTPTSHCACCPTAAKPSRSTLASTQ